jgi:hypothetical protein
MLVFGPNGLLQSVIGDAHDLAFYVTLGFLIAGIARLMTPRSRGGWVCFAFAVGAGVTSISIDAAARSREAMDTNGLSGWAYIDDFALALAVLLVVGTFVMFICMIVQDHVLRAGLSLVAFVASLVILVETLLLWFEVGTSPWNALAPFAGIDWDVLLCIIFAYLVMMVCRSVVQFAQRRSDTAA